MRLRTQRRRGSGLVEFAIIAPVLFMMLMGVVIGAIGVFNYQQVSLLAREGARYASVRGTQYAADTGQAAAQNNGTGHPAGTDSGTGTSGTIYTNAILPLAQGLNRSKLSSTVTWSTSNKTDSSVTVANTVTVTVSYQWVPLDYYHGVTFSSSSTAVMSY